mgnify:CR=1 FL=1
MKKLVINIFAKTYGVYFNILALFSKKLAGEKIINVCRRAKYLLLETSKGTLIMHLGMSGSLRILKQSVAAEKHEHIEILFNNGKVLRLRDPRRFGAALWTVQPPDKHALLFRNFISKETY